MSKAPGIFVSYEDKKRRIMLIISVRLFIFGRYKRAGIRGKRKKSDIFIVLRVIGAILPYR